MADRPDKVALTPTARVMLEQLIEGTGGAVAMITGRTLEDLDPFLAPLSLPSAGSHGIQRRDARGVVLSVADEDAGLRSAKEIIRDYAARNHLLLEDKRGGSTLHYREAPHLETEARALIDGLAGEHEGLRAIHGHKVAEISLAGQDKGSALDAFMDEAPFMGRVPVAIGDDTTDEDAFRAAQARGGLGIRVGPAQSRARARFADIDALHHWLAASAESGMMILETP